MFQFQYGAIGSTSDFLPGETVTDVSIPVWCDWESHIKLMHNDEHCFNSSMVRLGVPVWRVFRFS